MHSYFKFPLLPILLGAAVLFASCTNEEPFQQDIDPELTLTAGSSILEMMKRISSNDGSYDNIVDGASCLDIQFPYTVSINGSELGIEAMEDLQQIEDSLDAAEDGEAVVEIAYPITITTADYTEVEVDGEEMLHNYIEQCVEGGDDDDIECIDVTYPVSIFTFDPNLQQTGNVTVNHDKELHRFLAGLADSDWISIDFPLTFDVFDSTQVTVNNNSELADVMERTVEICDEDDDDDHNDDDFTKESLDSLLVTCPWSVEKFERTDVESSEQYQDYLLSFMEDGQVTLEDGLGSGSEGAWSVTVSDFKVFLTMEFEDAENFNGTLYAYEIGEGVLKLDGGETDEIVLEQFCDYENQS